MAGSGTQPSTPRSHAGRNAIIAIAILIVLLLVVLVAVPLPHTTNSSFSISNPGSVSKTYTQSESLCPSGATASVSYTTADGKSVTFSIIDPSGGTVWSHDAASGSTSFTVQSCGSYQFGIYDWAGDTVNVNLSLSSDSPIL